MSETKAKRYINRTKQKCGMYIVVILTHLGGFHIMYGSDRKWK